MIFQHNGVEVSIPSVKDQLDPENLFEMELEEKYGAQFVVEFYDGKKYHKFLKTHMNPSLKPLGRNKKTVYVFVGSTVLVDEEDQLIRADTYIDTNQTALKDAVYKCAEHVSNLLPKSHDISL